MKTSIFAALILISSTANAGWFGPDNYDDCILESIKPSMAKEAVFAVKNACRSKFPLLEKNNIPCTRKNLTTIELEKLKLKSQNGKTELYNGNEFDVSEVNMRFQVKDREFPIEKNISPCDEPGRGEACTYDAFVNGFIAKNYTQAYGIPENATTYTLLSATKLDCQK